MTKLDKKDFNREVRIVTAGPYKPSVRQTPHMNTILASAYHVLQDQLLALANKSGSGGELDAAEVRKFGALVEAATKLSREEREQAKAFEPGELDDQELLLYAEKASKLLGGIDGRKESRTSKTDRGASGEGGEAEQASGRVEGGEEEPNKGPS